MLSSTNQAEIWNLLLPSCCVVMDMVWPTNITVNVSTHSLLPGCYQQILLLIRIPLSTSLEQYLAVKMQQMHWYIQKRA